MAGARFPLWLPLVALAAFVVAPIYVLAASLAVRAGVFDFSRSKRFSAEEARGTYAFLGALVAAAVSAASLLVTHSSNQRTLAVQTSVENTKILAQQASDARLTLDTAIASLNLLGHGAEFGTPPAVAGALTTLVHLGHPIIALRCLAAAWPGGPVDGATAAWILRAAYTRGSAETMAEAVYLASANASSWAGDPPDGSAPWPDFISGESYASATWDTRAEISKLCVRVILSRPKSIWGSFTNYLPFVAALDEIILKEPAKDIRCSAAGANCILLRTILEREKEEISFPSKSGGDRVLREMLDSAEAIRSRADSDKVLNIETLLPELEKWASSAPPDEESRPERAG